MALSKVLYWFTGRSRRQEVEEEEEEEEGKRHVQDMQTGAIAAALSCPPRL